MLRGISHLNRPALSLFRRVAIAPSISHSQFLFGRSFSTPSENLTQPSNTNVADNADNNQGTTARVGLLGQRYEVVPIRAVRRDSVGKRNAQWARMNGLIPGIVYGGNKKHDEVIKVFVSEADLRREVHKRKMTFLNTLFDIHVDGKSYRVLPRDFQLHPFRPKIICCNWVRYKSGKYPGAKVDIPLRIMNEERCQAFKDGGWLLELTHKLPVYAQGDEIPDAIMMDVRGKRLGDKIMASELQLPEGIMLRSREDDFAVAKFVGSRRGALSAQGLVAGK